MKTVLNLLAVAAIATFTSCASKPAPAPACASCDAKAPKAVNKAPAKKKKADKK